MSSGAPAAVCDRCGQDLAPGELKYILRLSITADFDGYLNESDTGKLDSGALLAELEMRSPEELEEDICLERAFLLCPHCRAAVLSDPLATGHGGGGPGWVT